MESNFIKERHVIRKEIFDNLRKDTQVGDIPIENPSKQIISFEEIVNEGLKQDLVVVSKQVDLVCQKISDYLKIKSALQIFEKDPHDIRVQTNLGCNFYAQCQIEDASKIYLCLGNDYFLHMQLGEACKMIDFLVERWTQDLDKLQEKASKIKSYIKVALGALGSLYEIDRNSE